MLSIAIDGACRRNGKVNCIASGGIFILRYDQNNSIEASHILTNYEIKSTNQRGELLALLTAIDYIWEVKDSAQIITDSEYIFNTVTKEWHKNWFKKGWITAAGDPVKNKDIWLEILKAQRRCEAEGLEFMLYHIKGHCMPFGKVTAQNLLVEDTTGFKLYEAIKNKVFTTPLKQDIAEVTSTLSIKNNGFELDPYILNHFIIVNTVADAVATQCVEAADALGL